MSTHNLTQAIELYKRNQQSGHRYLRSRFLLADVVLSKKVFKLLGFQILRIEQKKLWKCYFVKKEMPDVEKVRIEKRLAI
jgi:hypothetical protein